MTPEPAESGGTRREGVVVVGAALMDIHAVSRRPLVAATSNPARVSTSPGGVGRNIAENLARLGTAVDLVAVVGADPYGDALLEQAQSIGIGTGEVVSSPYPTGTYVAVLDADGELAVAASDVTATDALTVAALEPSRSVLESAALVVVDGNIPVACTAWLLDLAATCGTPVVLEPVSVPKARLVASVLDAARPLLLTTPNGDELAALGGTPQALHDQGVTHVWVRQGPRGSTLHTAGEAPLVLPARVVRTVDVTGAGDAMTAGFVHALLTGASPAEAAAYGQAAAELTIASPHTVRPDLTDALVRAHLTPDAGDPT